MRISLVHDWLNQVGGAEDVLAALVDLFPGAPIYTSIYWRQAMPAAWRSWPIHVTWMDRLPGVYRHHQPYLPFYPLAFQGLRLPPGEVVLSNKSGFCHGVRPPPGAVHVCYCLTPTRYVWGFEAYAQREGLGRAMRLAIQPLLAWLRRWDYAAAQRVHHFIAISTEVQRRIRQFYGRESALIFPPVDTRRFAAAANTVAPGAVGDYYLSLGRLIPYKRVDLAVLACQALGRPLWVGGAGRDQARLAALAGPATRLLGRVPEADLPGLFARCRAFIFPGLEDFGITPVQALAAGRPVIAYAGGGALDIVQDGVNGVLFHEPTPEALAAAIQRFELCQFDPAVVRASAERFGAGVFARELTSTLGRLIQPKSEL